MARKYLLTATMPDGYQKTIGPTAVPFTHYWRIVAVLENGKTEVFWGHTKSLAEANRKLAASTDAARLRGWKKHNSKSWSWCGWNSERPKWVESGHNEAN